jgi:uncharacterized protein YgbK (DUF1537 family)
LPLLRASFSQERIHYKDQEGKVVYAAKNGRSVKVFPAMEWLAAMCSHFPNRGKQMVRYYGYYSNVHSTSSGQVSRGKRQKVVQSGRYRAIVDEKTNKLFSIVSTDYCPIEAQIAARIRF